MLKETNDHVDIASHPGLGKVVERHRPGEHVFKTSLLQAAGDIEDEIKFREYFQRM